MSDPRATACDFLDFMERGRTVMLQDVAQLISIGCTHILFYHEVFKTGLFLNYKETLGTFCSTSVNLVSQSLKALLSELSSLLNNLHYDFNVHQKKSMDFMCSNSCKINDNVVTMKNDDSRTKTVIDMQNNLKYC